jgi:hypothetical protein
MCEKLLSVPSMRQQFDHSCLRYGAVTIAIRFSGIAHESIISSIVFSLFLGFETSRYHVRETHWISSCVRLIVLKWHYHRGLTLRVPQNNFRNLKIPLQKSWNSIISESISSPSCDNLNSPSLINLIQALTRSLHHRCQLLYERFCRSIFRVALYLD